jgi:hypothetical protein
MWTIWYFGFLSLYLFKFFSEDFVVRRDIVTSVFAAFLLDC